MTLLPEHQPLTNTPPQTQTQVHTNGRRPTSLCPRPALHAPTMQPPPDFLHPLNSFDGNAPFPKAESICMASLPLHEQYIKRHKHPSFMQRKRPQAHCQASLFHEAFYELLVQLASGELRREYQGLVHGWARSRRVEVALHWHGGPTQPGHVEQAQAMSVSSQACLCIL